MNRLESILVGIDFSDCSRTALGQAVRMAKWNNARLNTVHAVEYLTLTEAAWASHVPQEKLEREALGEAKQALHAWLREAGAGPEATASAQVGPPIDVMLRGVKETAANLLVLGVTGASMIPMGAGTLATKCLRKAPTKVLLVHGRQTLPFRNILVGVDFSEQSLEAVSQGLRVAAQDNAALHFIHVFSGSWGRYAIVPDPWEVDPRKAEQYRYALEQRLREFVGATAGRKTHFEVVEAGSHGHALGEYARRVNADLIVLGNKGKSNLRYVLLGSTVERLVREVPCSVLVVPPPATEG